MSKLRTLRQQGKGTLGEEGVGRATPPCDSAMHCTVYVLKGLATRCWEDKDEHAIVSAPKELVLW